MTVNAGWLQRPAAGESSLQWYFALVVLVLAALGLGVPSALAVGVLSFWHYALYWLAWRYRAIPMNTFKRDAVTMKSVALLALGAAYCTAPPDPWSIAAVCAGFLLNLAAARALGPDRTYYGHELAGMPPLRVRAFPYSHIAHPMLIGNMLAFGGTLLNPAFRADWWPLACAHVALNAGLMMMETATGPSRGPTAGRGAGAGIALVLAGAALGAATTYPGGVAAVIAAAVIGGGSSAYARVLVRTHAAPAAAPAGERNILQTEGSS